MESRTNIFNDIDNIDPRMKEKVHLFVTGELDENEHKEMFDWISASSPNRRYYDSLRASLRAVEYYRSERSYDIQQVRSRLNKRIKLSDDSMKKDYRILFRIAASLLILAIAYIVFKSIIDYNSVHSETIVYNSIESPFGSRVRVYLPDSTFCVLNAGSTLRYSVDFLDGSSREVILSGEGFFDIRENKHSEFVVRVGNIGITALGTVFNVKAYPEEALIEATLVEGLLRIEQGDNKKGTVILRPNEKISLVKEENGNFSESVVLTSGERTDLGEMQKIPIRDVQVEKSIDPVTEISWKDTEWVIRGITMAELSVLLERRYNVEIILGDGEVGSFSFSGTLKDEALEQVLFAIRSTAPIDYEIDGNSILLTQNNTLRKQYERIFKGKLNP